MNTTPCVCLLQLSRRVFRLCASKASRCSSGAPRLTTMTSSWPPHMSPPSHVSCSRSHSSSIKVRPYLQYMKRKIIAPPCPPYSHVCQVGDPVLRSHAAAVDPAAVPGAEVQQVIRTLVKVMRRLECVGLSAPQIGVPLRILALEYPEQMLKDSSPSSREARGISVQPLRVFVNPTLRVLDGRTALFQEACESLSGFSATVPRYLSVEVSGLDERGGAVRWQASGWPARILQHEMDHLEGVLYIDRMDSKTFMNIHWQQHNE
ncbi:peptide deformylase, mitochondrial [Pseudochaenichthys georgianus]|uniref:peptide deformylase, mitochondrial n=1 Tax=Pseudochaenichthys georgianus TaxID=52239 RepID=UPI00146A97BD|nr:peptide deformylase, mitochondrial [Pseudochaenichthys georgianus]